MKPCPSEEKQTNKNSAQISPYTNHPRAETKGRKNSTLKTGKKRPQIQKVKKKNEKAEKYYTNEGTN